MKPYDYLLVGAGLFNSVFAYKATKKGKSCLVVDKRNHLGGNIYCDEIDGIKVHKYGAHIFHTSNKNVWNFVTYLTDFNRYTNSPIASYKDKLYNLPFNMNTFYQMWGVLTPTEAQKIIDEQKEEAIAALNGREPKNMEEQALSLVGKTIYETLIKGYSEKQWGRKCSELPASIIKRIPIRMVFDNNYFNDLYQGIPTEGYNTLIKKLLNGIETRLNCNYLLNKAELDLLADKIIYSGPIDEFFDYEYGKLEYRTVRFETETLNTSNFQGNAVVNYTDASVPYTRIIEHKHFDVFGEDVYKNPITIISKEFSSEWKTNSEPFYPINDEKNTKLYQQYRDKMNNFSNIILGGRLADYKYYDMDDVIANSLDLAEKELK
jgi:UDP-galactopyranose mutase